MNMNMNMNMNKRLGYLMLRMRPSAGCHVGTSGRYAGAMATMAYAEGYKAFQLKFSPMVVQRAITLNCASPLHVLLGPFYSMGLLHATKKRKTISWAVSLGVAMLIAAVKRLPYPWRSIIDAGVVCGLGWGGASIAVFYAKALAGTPPGVDPQLP